MSSSKSRDGSAGDVDYGAFGAGYNRHRRPDPRIAAFIDRGLGTARTVLNVGAGAGAYEPTDREVTAVEPSASMRSQRPQHLASAIDAVAENLPFADQSFDASMASFTVHQWTQLEAGLRELRRVTRGPVVVLTCDPEQLDSFWLTEYAPEVIATETRRYPSIRAITSVLGGDVEVVPVPIPLDCTDRFNEAYYGRPELLLDPAARRACSAWSFVDTSVVSRFEAHLRRDLDSGAWGATHGHLRTQPQLRGSLRLIVGSPI
ncbi:MAG: class I SAM-dependent methyltransferase [Kofleriaceae bacterium]